MFPGWLKTWWAAPLIVWATVALVMVGFLASSEVIPSRLVSWLWLPLNLYQALLTLRIVRNRGLAGAVRRAWVVLLIGSLWSMAGDGVWLVLTEQGQAPTYDPVGDTFYLLEYVAWIAAILIMPALASANRVGISLDIATVLVASLTALWDAVLRPASLTHAQDGVGLFFAAAPVLGDVLILTSITVLLARRPVRALARPVAMLTVSMLLYVVIDLAYAIEAARDVYVLGGWLDLGWFAARGLLCVAALRQMEPPGDASRTIPSDLLERSAWMLPIFATGLAFYMAFRVVSRGMDSPGTLETAIGAGLLCLLVIVRQVHQSLVNGRLLRLLQIESDKSERLLLNILPPPIAARLKTGTDTIADDHPSVTVLFADLVGFTAMASRHSAAKIVAILDEIFSEFDRLADSHGLEKIKTIGDCYMAVAGLPESQSDHGPRAARMALAMRAALERVGTAHGVELALRVGLHSGPVVAGVIGQRKFAYDLWGDTVNIASRMESHGLPGRVHLSEATREALGERFEVESRGPLELKGRGLMATFFLLGERQA
jgi:class 3 adenylate cyclase